MRGLAGLLAPLVAPVAAVVPSVVVVPDLRGLLLPFVSTHRIGLRGLLPGAGYLVATDGRVAVRARVAGTVRAEYVPCGCTDKAGCLHGPGGVAMPAIDGLRWDAGLEGECFRLGAFPEEPEMVPCGMCDQWPYAEDCDCCGGTRQEENYRAGVMPWMPEHARRVRLYYVQRIMALPGVRFLMPAPGEDWGCPIRFLWEHGDGLVMPMRGCGRADDIILERVG